MEKTNTQGKIINNESDFNEKVQAVWNWTKEHGKELAIGGLSIAFLVALGKYHGRGIQIQALLKEKQSLSAEKAKLLYKNGVLEEQANSLRKMYYSLASDATRHRSSLGGQILADAKHSSPQLYS